MIGAKNCLTHRNVYVNGAAMPNVKVHAVCDDVVVELVKSLLGVSVSNTMPAEPY